MSRKFIVSMLAAAAFVFAVSLPAFAQFVPVSGTVQIENADGTKVPAAGALIEVYRTDIKQTLSSNKTDKKGNFAFAGLPFNGTFTFAVSAPGAAPTIFPHVKAGQEKLVITMHPGDGHKFTEVEARKGAAVLASPTATAELSAEDKKAREEHAKEVADIEAKNARNQKSGEIAQASLKAGNEAFNAKNYEVAIAKYTEGVDAQPDFVGSAPVLLSNRGAAYDARAIQTYNAYAKAPDPAVKADVYAKTKADLMQAIDSYEKAWKIYQTAPATDITNPQQNEANKLMTLRGAREAFKHAALTDQVDPAMIEAAKVMFPEYQKIETEAAKKAEADLVLADMYRVTGDSDNAIPAYKKILETNPEHLDALSGLGLSLVNNGYIKNDKAQMQEGANYLQKFVSLAPDTNKYKSDAVGLIESLKKEQNVAPQKLPKGKGKP